MKEMKTMLCVNSDGTYVVFPDDPQYTIKQCKDKDGNMEWKQVGRKGVYNGIVIPEHCMAINWQGLNPGEGPIEME